MSDKPDNPDTNLTCPALRIVPDAFSHDHSRAEWQTVGGAVAFHALRRPRPNVSCEACLTARIADACSSCVHFYATLAPMGLVEPGAQVRDGMLDVLADADFITRFSAMIAQLPAAARAGLEIVAVAVQPPALQA